MIWNFWHTLESCLVFGFIVQSYHKFYEMINVTKIIANFMIS